MPTRKHVNMNNEETGKGQEQGSILGNTTCEKFKHNVCAQFQAQSQHKNTGGNTLASRVPLVRGRAGERNRKSRDTPG